MRFYGHSQHTVDDKGRVSLPAKQRKALPDELVVVPSPIDQSLYVFSEEGYDKWIDDFFPEGFNPRSRSDQRFRKKLFDSAENVVVDAAGRIKLSAEHRKLVGIEKNVMVIGNDDHLEIEDLGVYEEERESEDSYDGFFVD